MRLVLSIIGRFFNVAGRFWWKYIAMNFVKSMFADCGKNVVIGKSGSFHYKHVHIGSNSSLDHMHTLLVLLLIYVLGTMLCLDHMFF